MAQWVAILLGQFLRIQRGATLRTSKTTLVPNFTGRLDLFKKS